MRIFVTGDNHIGLKYAGHEQAAVLKERRMAAFHDMVAAANQEECALFVMTGDLFENTYGISKREVKALLEILSLVRGTVVLLPGNHDYYDCNAKLWQYMQESMCAYDNMMLLCHPRPYTLAVDGEDVVLYPAPCTSLHSAPGQNNLDWIKQEKIPDDGTIRIGIAHGAILGETIDKEGQYFLMTREELQSIPMDAWLIGHTHVPFPRNLTEEFTVCDNIFNAGTHVQTDVACHTEGQCFIVNIEKGKPISAKKMISGNLHFYRKHVGVTPGAMEELVSRALSDIEDNSVVDVVLSGAVNGAEYETKDALLKDALSRFVEGTYNDYALTKQISRESIEAEFPETSFGAGLLLALLEEPKEAQMAYELLKALKEGNK